MRNVELYIATSLDGFIARANGEIDWLFSDADYGYEQFYASIDTTLTGGETYRQTLTFGDELYPGKTNYVFTRRPPKQRLPDDRKQGVTFVTSGVADFVRTLKQQPGKDIWLVGGSQINTLLMNAQLIDRITISIHPIVLGSGIPLFAAQPATSRFALTDQKAYQSGLMQLMYKRLAN